MTVKSKYVVIRLTRETKDKLDCIGKKSDTYEDIVKVLLETFEEHGRCSARLEQSGT